MLCCRKLRHAAAVALSHMTSSTHAQSQEQFLRHISNFYRLSLSAAAVTGADEAVVSTDGDAADTAVVQFTQDIVAVIRKIGQRHEITNDLTSFEYLLYKCTFFVCVFACDHEVQWMWSYS